MAQVCTIMQLGDHYLKRELHYIREYNLRGEKKWHVLRVKTITFGQSHLDT